jgi:hypothetical protein
MGVGTCALVVAADAHAQTPSPEDMAAARSLGTEGVKLADSGDCAGAIPKLEAAEKIFHAPTTLERLGECQIKVGRFVAGTENLNRVVREPLAPNAPAAFVTAHQRAQAALGPALPRIGKLKIHIEGAPPDKVTATVDGEAVPSALFDADRPTDPGTHEVKASAPGFLPSTTTTTVPDGQEASVSLKLQPDPNAAAAAVPSGAPAGAPTSAPAGATVSGGTVPPPTTVAPTKGSSNGLAIGALVVGGVGIAVGSVFGVLSLGKKSTLDKDCPTKSNCPTTSQGDIDALKRDATISTVGFGVGIAGVALGGILLATSHGPEGRTGSTESPSVSPRVTPWIGLGSVGVRGAF